MSADQLTLRVNEALALDAKRTQGDWMVMESDYHCQSIFNDGSPKQYVDLERPDNLMFAAHAPRMAKLISDLQAARLAAEKERDEARQIIKCERESKQCFAIHESPSRGKCTPENCHYMQELQP